MKKKTRSFYGIRNVRKKPGFFLWTAETADIHKTVKNRSILRFILQMNISPSGTGNQLKTAKNDQEIALFEKR